jgi:hypothetical protein
MVIIFVKCSEEMRYVHRLLQTVDALIENGKATQLQ